MDTMNDIYEAKELLGENLHELIQYVKKNCDGDLLASEHEPALCAMKMLLSCLSKAGEIEGMEQLNGGESLGSQRGRMPYAYGNGGMRAGNGNGMGGGSQAQRRNPRTGRYMDEGPDIREDLQERINSIPDRQTRMDMQRMLDALGNH